MATAGREAGGDGGGGGGGGDAWALRRSTGWRTLLRGDSGAPACGAGVACGGGGLAGRRCGLLRLGARAAGRFGFDLADRFLERQALARDFGFLQRRIDTAQLRDQRGARPLIERTPVLAGVLSSPATARAISG